MHLRETIAMAKPSEKDQIMSPDEKEPSTPYGVPDKDEKKKPNFETGEPSAPYGEEEATPTTEPARKE